MVRTANVDGNHLAVKLDHGSNLSLVCLPLVALFLNFRLSCVQLSLHIHVESLQEFVISNQLVADLVVLQSTIVEQIVDFGDVLGEYLLDLLDAGAPDALHVADTGHAIYVDSLG